MSEINTELSYLTQKFSADVLELVEKAVKEDFDENWKQYSETFKSFESIRSDIDDCRSAANDISSYIDNLDTSLRAINLELEEVINPFS